MRARVRLTLAPGLESDHPTGITQYYVRLTMIKYYIMQPRVAELSGFMINDLNRQNFRKLLRAQISQNSLLNM